MPLSMTFESDWNVYLLIPAITEQILAAVNILRCHSVIFHDYVTVAPLLSPLSF